MSTTDRSEMPTSSAKMSTPLVGLVHLSAVSVVLAAHLVNPSAFAARSTSTPEPHGDVSVPTAAAQGPASYSQPAVVGTAVLQRRVVPVATGAAREGIPSAALAAYQRAETVINAADKTCHLDWQLLAAVGRVESDHGRAGGSILGADGVARPGIYGEALDGTKQTEAIPDTDFGRYDHDRVWDRAVGPMQFIPAAWSAVGVDADGDGRRDPQDINDAALAAAVHFCSGPQDLADEAGRRAAVLRYNHSQPYVDQVLQTRTAYLDGDYAAVPPSVPATYGPGFSRRDAAGSDGQKETPKPRRVPRSTGDAAARPASGPAREADGREATGSRSGPPASKETPAPPPEREQDRRQDEGDGALEKVTEPLPVPVREPVDRVLTLAEAVTRCKASGVSRLDLVAWDTCIDDLVR